MPTATTATVVAVPDRCPLCDSPITRAQFVQIEARIREREKLKLDKQRKELEERFERQTKAHQEAAAKKERARADARIAEISAARDAAVKKAAAVEEQAEEATKAAVKSEAAKVRASLEEEYKERREKEEAATASKHERLAEEITELKEARKESEAALAEAKSQSQLAREEAEAAKRQAADAQKKAVDSAVSKARRVLGGEHEKELAERSAKAARDRESLLKKIAGLQRQLADRSPNELGDGAELDLFDTLRDAFPDDRITRIQKGQRGADIKVEVLHRGSSRGCILIDSKNRKAWQKAFAAKLREDQIEAEADHAILSTTAFPSGKRQLCIESEVIIAQPGRVRELVSILRGEIIKAHVLGLANEKRSEKREALYRFISSEQFRQKMEEVDRLATEALNLDVEEEERHRRTWEKRGRMLRKQQRALGDIQVEISAIVEGIDQE